MATMMTMSTHAFHPFAAETARTTAADPHTHPEGHSHAIRAHSHAKCGACTLKGRHASTYTHLDWCTQASCRTCARLMVALLLCSCCAVCTADITTAGPGMDVMWVRAQDEVQELELDRVVGAAMQDEGDVLQFSCGAGTRSVTVELCRGELEYAFEGLNCTGELVGHHDDDSHGHDDEHDDDSDDHSVHAATRDDDDDEDDHDHENHDHDEPEGEHARRVCHVHGVGEPHVLTVHAQTHEGAVFNVLCSQHYEPFPHAADDATVSVVSVDAATHTAVLRWNASPEPNVEYAVYGHHEDLHEDTDVHGSACYARMQPLLAQTFATEATVMLSGAGDHHIDVVVRDRATGYETAYAGVEVHVEESGGGGSGGGLSDGEAAIVAVGCVLAVAIVVAAVLYYRRPVKEERHHALTDSAAARGVGVEMAAPAV